MNSPDRLRMSRAVGEHVHVLLNQLEDSQADERTQHRAIRELGHLRAHEAIGVLSRILRDDPNEWTRTDAATALGEIGRVEASSVLIEALDE